MNLRDWQRRVLPELINALRKGFITALSAPTGSGKTLVALLAALELGTPITVFVRSKSQFQPWFKAVNMARGFDEEVTLSVLVGQGEACQLASKELASSAPCDLCALNKPLGVEPPKPPLKVKPGDLVKDLVRRAGPLNSCAYKTLTHWSDVSRVLITTYPYLLVDNVRKAIYKRFLKSVVVVDEAHNLDSALDEYVLTRGLLENAKKQARLPETRRVINAVLSIIRKEESWVKVAKPIELVGYLDYLTEESWRIYGLMIRREHVGTNYISILTEFVSRLVEDRFQLYSGYGRLKLVDPDPASVLSVLSKPRAVMLLSATLPPMDYMRKVWGLERPIKMIVGRSEWSERFEVKLIGTELTTRFKERSGGMWDAYASRIKAVWDKSSRSVLVVCPSYEVLNEVALRLHGLPCIIEDASSRAEDVEEQLMRGKRLVLAVARGKLVEGVEFTDTEGRSVVSDVVIVGIPYKKPDPIEEERAKRIRARARLTDKEVELYLKFMPAWQAVVQAIGRAVRSSRDKANLWLLDKRFSDERWLERLTPVVIS